MSRKRPIKVIEVVVIVLPIFGALFAVLCHFGCVPNRKDQSEAGAARAGTGTPVTPQGMLQHETKAMAPTNKVDAEAVECGPKFSPQRARKVSPCFGRRAEGSPPRVSSSQVEDDRPMPPDGGGCHQRK